MFPIQDSTPRKTTPYVNYLIILANVAVFIIELMAPNFDKFVTSYSFVPSNFNFLILGTYGAIFTSMFLHGSILHILSNMWFLHIFGDNIEDRYGHVPFLFFYLVAGFVAAITQYFFTVGSSVPTLGASGAISGVVGAYLVLFRRSTIETLIIFFIVNVPSWFFIGYWFFLQVISGIGAIATNSLQFGGTAYFAHIGGFVFGFLATLILKRGENKSSKK